MIGLTTPAPTTVVTRPLRHIGEPAMEHPPTITYRADMEAEVRERLLRAGMVFADEGDPPGAFW